MTDQENIFSELEKKKSEVDYSIRLPEAELEIMLAVWELEAPVTTSMLMELIGKRKGWKAPTLISFLSRLESRGFLLSHKSGKERRYYPTAERSRYVGDITKRFVQTCHGGSFVKMLDSLFEGREFADSDIDDLLIWLKNRK